MRNVRAAIDALKKNRDNEIILALPQKQSNQTIIKKLYNKIIFTNIKEIHYIQSPLESIEGFLGDIMKIIKKEKIDIVMPFGHASVGACSYGKEKIEEYSKLIFPDFETFMNFHDKWKTIEICKRANVPAPITFHPKDIEDLENYKSKITFPCIIKAQMGCGIKQGVRKANNWNELIKYYKEITSNENYEFLDNFERPIIQEFMEGKIHDVVGVFNNGDPVGVLSQKRYITYPIEGGTGSVNITTKDSKAIEYMKKLMKEVKWTGPAMGEFMYIEKEDEFKLIEVNPKFWGTLALSLSVGMNFPKMAADLALKNKVTEKFDYPENYMYRWSLTEEIKSLSQYDSKWEAFKEYFLRSFRKNKSSEFSWKYFLRSMALLLSTFKFISNSENQYSLEKNPEDE